METTELKVRIDELVVDLASLARQIQALDEAIETTDNPDHAMSFTDVLLTYGDAFDRLSKELKTVLNAYITNLNVENKPIPLHYVKLQKQVNKSV